MCRLEYFITKSFKYILSPWNKRTSSRVIETRGVVQASGEIFSFCLIIISLSLTCLCCVFMFCCYEAHLESAVNNSTNLTSVLLKLISLFFCLISWLSYVLHFVIYITFLYMTRIIHHSLSYLFFPWLYSPFGPWTPHIRRFLELFRHMVRLLGRVISPSQGLYLHRTTQHRKTRTNIHALSGIRTHDSSNQPFKTHASDRTATVTSCLSYKLTNKSKKYRNVFNEILSVKYFILNMLLCLANVIKFSRYVCRLLKRNGNSRNTKGMLTEKGIFFLYSNCH
jgi:hypothetical protein